MMRVQRQPLHNAGRVTNRFKKSKFNEQEKNAGKTWTGHLKKTRLRINERQIPLLSTDAPNGRQKKAAQKLANRKKYNIDGKRRQETKESAIAAGLGIMLAGAFVCGVASNCNKTQEKSQGNGPKEDSKDQQLAKKSQPALKPSAQAYSMPRTHNGFLRHVQNTLWGLATYDPFPSFPPGAAAADMCKTGTYEKKWRENHMTLTTKETGEFERSHPDMATQLNRVTEFEFNELLVKISEGDIPSVKQMITQAPGILNQKDQDGYTCIDYAIGNKQPELAEWMLGFNPDLTTQNKDGDISLTLAIIKGQSELAKRMIEKNPALLNIKNDNGVTVLMQAIYNNKFDIVEYMLGFNPDLTIQTTSGETACALALFKENNTLAKQMIKKHPELLRIQRKDGQSPLMIAIESKAYELAKWMINKDPSILNQTDQNGDTCIGYAIGHNQPELAEWMLGYDPDLTTLNKDGRIALELALIKEQSELAKHMIKKNPAILNIKNDNGVTVLMQAIYHNMFEIVEYMLAFNPDLTIQTTSGETACALALFKKNNTLAKQMIKKHPELLRIQTKDGQSPLMIAIESKAHKFAKWMIDKDPSILNQRDQDGQTVLMRAIDEGQIKFKKLIKLILEKGSDLSLKNKYGVTALHYVLNLKDIKLVKLGMQTNTQAPSLGVELTDALIQGDIRKVMQFLKRSDNVTLEFTNLLMAKAVAFRMDNIKLLRQVIRTNDGDMQNTVFSFAVNKGNMDVVKELLETNAVVDVNIKENHLSNAMALAFKEGRDDILDLIIEKCKDIDLTSTLNAGKMKLKSYDSIKNDELYEKILAASNQTTRAYFKKKKHLDRLLQNVEDYKYNEHLNKISWLLFVALMCVSALILKKKRLMECPKSDEEETEIRRSKNQRLETHKRDVEKQRGTELRSAFMEYNKLKTKRNAIIETLNRPEYDLGKVNKLVELANTLKGINKKGIHKLNIQTNIGDAVDQIKSELSNLVGKIDQRRFRSSFEAQFLHDSDFIKIIETKATKESAVSEDIIIAIRQLNEKLSKNIGELETYIKWHGQLQDLPNMVFECQGKQIHTSDILQALQPNGQVKALQQYFFPSHGERIAVNGVGDHSSCDSKKVVPVAVATNPIERVRGGAMYVEREVDDELNAMSRHIEELETSIQGRIDITDDEMDEIMIQIKTAIELNEVLMLNGCMDKELLIMCTEQTKTHPNLIKLQKDLETFIREKCELRNQITLINKLSMELADIKRTKEERDSELKMIKSQIEAQRKTHCDKQLLGIPGKGKIDEYLARYGEFSSLEVPTQHQKQKTHASLTKATFKVTSTNENMDLYHYSRGKMDKGSFSVFFSEADGKFKCIAVGEHNPRLGTTTYKINKVNEQEELMRVGQIISIG